MKIRLLASAALLLLSAAADALDFEGKGRELVGEIMANPGAFLFDIQQDAEATAPLVPGKKFGIQTALLPAILPAGYVNLSLKARVHPEGRLSPGLPQLDVIGGYWDMAWAQLAASQAQDYVSGADFRGWYAGLMASASVSPRVRLFGGCKHSRLTARLDLKKPQELFGAAINSFDTVYEDDFLIAGLEHPTAVNKWWTMQVNYGVRNKSIAAKVSWYGKNFELGLNIYPEGVLVIHPIWNFHVNF
ncbi:MAG: hypothetical protein PHP45_10860 [Elusimicrobiales bacterium]|nr:hypothetical protein [Elusimicrobiales bacterium]